MDISVAARGSPLSKVQVKEVLDELKKYHPHLIFSVQYMKTTGDLDRKTSLRSLDKTDFFTREVDRLLLEKRCRIAIHSAKDLSDPIPSGLKVIAYTHGKDPSDSLVLRDGIRLEDLPKGAVIATSSKRRESAVSRLRADFNFVDIRGTIGERLEVLEKGKIDGVVIAEAALLRLGLGDIHRLKIPGATVPFQGQLAIVAREDDLEMERLFSCIDSKRVMTFYTGIEVSESWQDWPNLLHCPLIEVKGFSSLEESVKDAFGKLEKCTHVLFTSKNAVCFFLEKCRDFGMNRDGLKDKSIFCVGKATAQFVEEMGLELDGIATPETAEGMVDLIDQGRGERDVYFWPRSVRARSVIGDYFKTKRMGFVDCPLYSPEVRSFGESVSLERVREVVFTSPSTVDAFLEVYGGFPKGVFLTSIGFVTDGYLGGKMNVFQLDS